MSLGVCLSRCVDRSSVLVSARRSESLSSDVACDKPVVLIVALIACKSALTILLLGRRAFASQRVSVCLPATRFARSGRVLKSTPGGSKIDPRRVQNRVKLVQGGQRAAQSAPRASQVLPMSAQERPKSVPRASQEPPKSAQERPKSA